MGDAAYELQLFGFSACICTQYQVNASNFTVATLEHVVVVTLECDQTVCVLTFYSTLTNCVDVIPKLIRLLHNRLKALISAEQLVNNILLSSRFHLKYGFKTYELLGNKYCSHLFNIRDRHQKGTSLINYWKANPRNRNYACCDFQRSCRPRPFHLSISASKAKQAINELQWKQPLRTCLLTERCRRRRRWISRYFGESASLPTAAGKT